VTALEYEKHVPIQYNGAIASYGSLTYLLTTVLTGYISHIMPKRLFILLSFVSITIGLFLMGPSDILGLPNYIWLFLVGYGLVGAAQGFLFIPILPEIIEAFSDRYEIKEGENEEVDEDVSDRASGLYGAFYYTGMIISPITGSLIYHNLKSFNKTCDLFAMFSIGYIIIYYIFNILPDRKTLWQHN
jgi:MFS family permease